MNKQVEEQVLQVLLYRKDQIEPIVIMESTDFSECKKVWKSLIDTWTKAHKEAEPFVLEKPIVTAVEPGIIGEIKIFPKKELKMNIDPNNPYQKRMMQVGLSDMKNVRQNIYNSELMDEGFNF